MRRALAVVFTIAAAAVVALVGMLLMAYAQVGANEGCVDLYIQEVTPACVAPTAAPWALALGGTVGAGVGAGVALLVLRRRANGSASAD